jgi:hypothetical protein
MRNTCGDKRNTRISSGRENIQLSYIWDRRRERGVGHPDHYRVALARCFPDHGRPDVGCEASIVGDEKITSISL